MPVTHTRMLRGGECTAPRPAIRHVHRLGSQQKACLAFVLQCLGDSRARREAKHLAVPPFPCQIIEPDPLDSPAEPASRRPRRHRGILRLALRPARRPQCPLVTTPFHMAEPETALNVIRTRPSLWFSLAPQKEEVFPVGPPQADALKGKRAPLAPLQPRSLDLDALCAPIRSNKRAVPATVQPPCLGAINEKLLGGNPRVEGLEREGKLPRHVHAVAVVLGESLAHLLVPAAHPTPVMGTRQEVEQVGGLERIGKGGTAAVARLAAERAPLAFSCALSCAARLTASLRALGRQRPLPKRRFSQALCKAIGCCRGLAARLTLAQTATGRHLYPASAAGMRAANCAHCRVGVLRRDGDIFAVDRRRGPSRRIIPPRRNGRRGEDLCTMERRGVCERTTSRHNVGSADLCSIDRRGPRERLGR